MEIIENNLTLVGSTAIEDCLQDGVEDTLKKMREAGIKVWMITGDKIETAINIGRSCGLIEQGSTEIIISSESLLAIKKSVNAAFTFLRDDETGSKLTVIFSGATFSKIQ